MGDSLSTSGSGLCRTCLQRGAAGWSGIKAVEQRAAGGRTAGVVCRGVGGGGGCCRAMPMPAVPTLRLHCRQHSWLCPWLALAAAQQAVPLVPLHCTHLLKALHYHARWQPRQAAQVRQQPLRGIWVRPATGGQACGRSSSLGCDRRARITKRAPATICKPCCKVAPHLPREVGAVPGWTPAGARRGAPRTPGAAAPQTRNTLSGGAARGCGC